MTRWQRRTRLALVAFIVFLSAVVFFALRERREPAAAVVIERADPDAVIESTGAIGIQTRAGRQSFRVEAERWLTYPDGRTRLLPGASGSPVKIVIPQPEGEPVEVTGAQVDIGANRSTATLAGGVRVDGGEGLAVETSRATYDDEEGIVRMPESVDVRYGRLAGSGLGATYDRARNIFRLLDQAQITVATETAGAVTITAGEAGLARQDQYIRFDRGVRIVRTGQVIESDGAVAYLTSGGGGFERVELRGAARITDDGSGAGSLEAMQAADMDLHYATDGASLERASLRGNAEIRVGGAPGREGRRVAADTLELELASDGETLVRLIGRERVALDVPADADGPARQIRAAALDGAGEPPAGITRARFSGDVAYHETSGGHRSAAAARTARATALELTVEPGLAAIETAHFTGHVTFADGALRARGREARYLVSRGMLELPPSERHPGPEPQVADERISVDARRIRLTLEGRGLTAEENVRSIVQPARASSGGDPLRTPSMLDADQPVYVTAQRLEYEGAAGRATYHGEARLWQGDTAIQAETVTLDERTGNLSATGSARSSLYLDQVDDQTGAPERVLTVATAETLEYEEAERRATYTTAARVDGPQGDLEADRIELYLDASGRGLERAEAYGSVVVRLEEDERVASGDRLTYFAAEGRYLMGGAPVRIVERLGAECRETAGRTLTFFRSADTISVDGHGELPTRTTVRGNCSERR